MAVYEFTDPREIAKLEVPATGYRIYRYTKAAGLAVRVASSGSRRYVFCYMSDEVDGRGVPIQRRISLGVKWSRYESNWEEAKRLADLHRGRLAEGVAPESRKGKLVRLRQEKQQAEQEITVSRLIDRYIAEWARPRKRRWDEDERRLDKHVRPVWGDRKVKDIRRADVDALVAPVALGNADDGTPARPAEANHRLAVIRKMFSFAVDKGIIESHPCLRMKAPGGRIAARDRALITPKELRLIWRITDGNGPWVRARPESWPRDVAWNSRGRMSPTIADCLRLVLATAVRAREATDAAWSEFQLDEGIWVIPGKRTKNGRTHLVPLLPEIVVLLSRRRDEVQGDYVFPGQRAGTAHINDKHLSEALGNACRRLARLGLRPFTTHDLRRTVETGMAAARVPKEYRDRVLNHVDASVGGKHYNVHDYKDEKREALEKWARRLESMLVPERSNVVPLRGVA
ncbi:tyrosine-type recombinase/integrase [Pseudoxanthomonas japonensis]|uniref:tyrosine-type recombinase/integrase n=1 Tax=Pseudoxanthomonas japonensis TaxID=69284 RepID=UPI003748830A